MSTRQPINLTSPQHPTPCWGRVLRLSALLALVPTWVACTHLDVPRAESYPETQQHKARAVHHWDVLADDVAQRIQFKTQQATGDAVAGYHLTPSTVSPFHRAFADLLLTRLVNRDVPMQTVSRSGDQAMGIIRFDVQVVQHASSGYNPPKLPLTVLATGLSVLRNFYLNPPSELGGAALGVATALALDASNLNLSGTAMGGPTRTELLVSTTVEHGTRIVARTSDVYYIEARDASLFVAPPPPPPPPPPAPTKNWKVVGGS